MIVLILGISSVFAEENQQEGQELCENVRELEAEAFLLEQSIMAAQEDGAEVEVPVPEAPSEMIEGETPSCDEMTALIEDRIEQLEAYIEENEIELLDEEEMEEIKEKNNVQKRNADDQSGNDVSAMMSQGMPSCEQNTMLLRQRIADLEQFIEDNELEVPEPSEDEAAAIEDNSEESSESEEADENGAEGQGTSEEKQEEPKQGFFRGMFKKMFSFFDENKEGEEPGQQPMMPPPMIEEPNEEAAEET